MFSCQALYNKRMVLKNYIKSLLSLNAYTIKKLAEEMTVKTGKKYTQGSLSNKINRETISLKEAFVIADILGYKLEFNPKK